MKHTWIKQFKKVVPEQLAQPEQTVVIPAPENVEGALPLETIQQLAQ